MKLFYPVNIKPVQHRFSREIMLDVNPFSTVCYELLANAWPFHEYPVESIVYQVGKGSKQSLSKLDVAREMKVWSGKKNFACSNIFTGSLTEHIFFLFRI